MNKSPAPHLAYIIDTLEKITTLTPDTCEAFATDMNAQDATLMRLQDIGEQLVHIRDQFPEFWKIHHSDTWFKMIGLRNIISHGYREIDFDIIWTVVREQLDDFTASIKTSLEQVR